MRHNNLSRLAIGICVPVLVAGGVTSAAAVIGAGAAQAQTVTCDAGAGCSGTGTLTITSGVLNLTSPSALQWGATLTGVDQSVADTFSADQQLNVDDATGSATGWHITTSSSTFTNGTHVLPDAGTLVVTGGVGSITSTDSPSSACSGGSTCTLPTDTTTYPVAIDTGTLGGDAGTTIYDTATGSGVGSIELGGSTSTDPIGWWVNVPSNAFAGAYVSTLTMAVVSGP